MAFGDIYQLNMLSQSGQQQQLNRFFYYQGNSNGDVQSLVDLFALLAVPIIADILASSTTIHGVQATNILVPSDTASTSISVPGTQGGEFAVSYYVAAFELNTGNGMIGLGRKAFGRIVEADMANGNPATGAAVRYQAVADLMIAELIDGGTGEVWVHGLYSPANATHLGNVFSSVDASQFKRFSTQNSRKNF